MAHLLTQPQQNLQLNYKTTITQNRQKIELRESLTTMELKKSHSYRKVVGEAMQRRGDAEWATPHNMWWIKIGGILKSEGSQPHTRPPNPGFQCQEDKSP